MLLAMDSSTDVVSVALHDGVEVVAERAIDARRQHAELLVPLIREVLESIGATTVDIHLVAVGTGPGAFTGLRVGLATARTFAQARSIECVGVMSLDVLAQHAIAEGSVGIHERFAVAIDARRREVFAAVIDGGRREGDPFVIAPTDAAAGLLAGLTVVGDAVRTYPDVFTRAIDEAPAAGTLARIVDAVRAGTPGAPEVELLAATPVYLRRPDATAPPQRPSRPNPTAPLDR